MARRIATPGLLFQVGGCINVPSKKSNITETGHTFQDSRQVGLRATEREAARGVEVYSFVYSSNSERRISDESSNRGQLISFCSKVGFW